MNHPRVSIVVPVYNGEKYIKDTLRSIVAQSYRNIECIVVDDGSTDNTVEVCREFADSVLVLSKPNGGQSDALNYGWKRASGDYLSYLSADDLLHDSAIEHLVADAESMPGKVVVFPGYQLIDGRGKRIKDFHPRFFDKESMFEKFYCPIGPGAIFSRSLFNDFGGWRTDLRQIPDFEYWLRLANAASFMYHSTILSSFRVHVASQTYAISSFEKSEESIVVAQSLAATANEGGINSDRFIASAHLFSACLHFRSGRIATGFRRLMTAGLFSPRTMLSLYALRRVFSACTSYLRYASRS